MCTIKMHLISIHFISEVNLENGSVTETPIHTHATSKRSVGQISMMAAMPDVLVAQHSTDGIECMFIMYCCQQERWLWNPTNTRAAPSPIAHLTWLKTN
ncbi:unnamed protein product [Cercopithifilaria johnstoni]|uniref:Uncharacterized protein n=1 Tax=Cercopithifilaria johnstoni TaxID=2874296 RepID=A0A8J2MTS5_9BILA|nr:unnamed protein product [Cercopithifilaria johnstoni]